MENKSEGGNKDEWGGEGGEMRGRGREDMSRRIGRRKMLEVEVETEVEDEEEEKVRKEG